ncbi:MAG: hypothetical protein B6I38_02730 [Anaerolineaceae bacterium 4572_5.1]|nr:MAG: hypothetical protein B6I38_02730 [Anaerolineaceae bacterium 4572_5.1]
MYKLIILIPPNVDETALDESWPEFLHHAEQMPGLVRESVAHVQEIIYGREMFTRAYEFLFPSKETLYRALTSPHGERAGQLIHEMTQGRATILTAEHKEDELENIRPSETSEV